MPGQKPCPTGKVRDPHTKRCRKPCPPGKIIDPLTRRCRKPSAASKKPSAAHAKSTNPNPAASRKPSAAPNKSTNPPAAPIKTSSVKSPNIIYSHKQTQTIPEVTVLQMNAHQEKDLLTKLKTSPYVTVPAWLVKQGVYGVIAPIRWLLPGSFYIRNGLRIYFILGAYWSYQDPEFMKAWFRSMYDLVITPYVLLVPSGFRWSIEQGIEQGLYSADEMRIVCRDYPLVKYC
jgi:hypothetical protein